jgi:hypothetical protein
VAGALRNSVEIDYWPEKRTLITGGGKGFGRGAATRPGVLFTQVHVWYGVRQCWRGCGRGTAPIASLTQRAFQAMTLTAMIRSSNTRSR